MPHNVAPIKAAIYKKARQTLGCRQCAGVSVRYLIVKLTHGFRTKTPL